MGIRDLTKRLRTSVDQLDDRRLQDRFSGLGLTCIGDMSTRTPVRVGGEITRMKVKPLSGITTFEITVDDGTGTVIAVFTGRRHLGGVEHNRALVLEGVARTERNRLVMLNPAYTLLPQH